ncbi:Protein 21.1, putative [Giardia lamblia P15]|uniref:Protein 21.1, putative n=1 Tax=Giardia intestinalis (strain P15) TaxID=658858 RepID=E1F6Q5_GIAIA|nr:Protein 21.1, putative [Giardia lamblia P15]
MSTMTRPPNAQLPALPRPYSYIETSTTHKMDSIHATARNTVTGETLLCQFSQSPQLDETGRWLLQLDAQYICMLRHVNLLSYRSIYYDPTLSTVVTLTEVPGPSLLSFCTEHYATTGSLPPECILWRIAAQTLSIYHYLQTQELSLCTSETSQYYSYITPTMTNTYVSDSSSSFSIKLSFVGATHSGLDYSIIQPEDLLFKQRKSNDIKNVSFTRRTNVILSLKALGLLLYNFISFGVSHQLSIDFLPQEKIEEILQSKQFKEYSPEFLKIFSLFLSPGIYIQENAIDITHSDIDLLSFLSHPMILSALIKFDTINLQLRLQSVKKLYLKIKSGAQKWLTRKGLLTEGALENSVTAEESRIKGDSNSKQRKERHHKMKVSFHTDLSVQNYDKNSCIDPNVALAILDKPTPLATDFVLSTNITLTDNVTENKALQPLTSDMNSTSSTGYFVLSKKCDWHHCICELKKGRIRPYRYTRIFISQEPTLNNDDTLNDRDSMPNTLMEETSFFVSPLIIAALENDVKGIIQFAPKYAGLRSDRDGMTALMLAAEAGYVEATLELRNYEACLRSTTFATAMMLAVAADQTETAKCLVEYEHGSTDKASRTALRIAVERDNIDMVFHLAKYESEIGDLDNYTPLMCSIEQRKYDIARLLVPYASRCQTTDRHKKTALLLALEQGYLDLADCLIPLEVCLQDGNGTTALIVAIERGYVEIADRLVLEEQGLCDKKGRTALMYAAKRGSHGLVQKLVDAEAKRQDTKGLTALMVAVAKEHVELIDILAHHEAGITNNEGHYAINIAIHKNNREIISILLEHEGQYLSHETLLKLLKTFHSSDIPILLRLNSLLQKHSTRFSLILYASSHSLNDLCSHILHYPQLVARHDHLYLITYLQRTSKDTEDVWKSYFKAVNTNQAFRISYLMMNTRLRNEELHNYIDEKASSVLRFKMFLEYIVVVSVRKEFEPLEKYCSSMAVYSKHKSSERQRVPILAVEGVSFTNLMASSNPNGSIQSPMEFLEPRPSEFPRPGEFPVKNFSTSLANILIDFLLEYATTPVEDLSHFCEIYDATANDMAALIQELEEHNLCCYCHVQPMSLIYWPCRHLYACHDCARSIQRQCCEICRGRLEGGIPLSHD